jgi:hypothetical protein
MVGFESDYGDGDYMVKVFFELSRAVLTVVDKIFILRRDPGCYNTTCAKI